MARFKKILKQLVYPITFLTLVTLFSIIVTIDAVYIAFTNDPTAAIYAAITIPITLFIICLYVIDRVLVKRIPYHKLMIGEIVVGIFAYVLFSYQNSYTEINFYTDQDYIIVLFDSKENSISKFNKKGMFGKELNVYDTNIIHLDSTMSLLKDLKINNPKEWEGSSSYKGILHTNGDSIDYFYSSKNRETINFRKNTEAYIDSLLKKNIDLPNF